MMRQQLARVVQPIVAVNWARPRPWVVLSLIAAALLALVESPLVLQSALNPLVTLGAPVVVHNARIEDGRVVMGPKQALHAEVAWEAPVKPGRRYQITASLDNLNSIVSISVYGDFNGVGYDNPDQDFFFDVPAGASSYTVSRTIPSDSPPQRTWLRLFHFESAQLRVRHIEVRESSPVVSMFGGVVRLALLIACLGTVVSWFAQLQRTRRSRLLWLTCLVAVAGVAVLSNSLLGPPQIFSDEYAYWATTRALLTHNWSGLRDTGSIGYPNRLFFAAYRPVGLAEEPFVAGRALNTAWLLAGVAVLYGASRKLKVMTAGAIVALAYGIGPLASYTAYFMPDTMFAALFMLAVVLCSVALGAPTTLAALGAGVSLAALPLTKPNGWIIVAGSFLFGAYYAALRWRTASRPTRIRWLLVPVAFGLCWLLLSAVLPDTPARQGFFGAYSAANNLVLKTMTSAADYGAIARLLAVHLVIAATLFAVPLVYGTIFAFRRNRTVASSPTEEVALALTGLSVVMLAMLLGTTAVFTTAATHSGGFDTIDRLHTRYYSFAFPLMLIGLWALPRTIWTAMPLRIAALIAWLGACIACFVILPSFHWTIIDAPDLFVEGAPKYALALAGVLGVGVAIALRHRPRGLAIGVLSAFAAAAVTSGLLVRSVQMSWGSLPADRAARAIVAIAEQTRAPIVLICNLGSMSQWPYRIAAHAPGRSHFARPEQLAGLISLGLPAGALIISTAADVPPRGTMPIAQFGDLVVARLTDPAAALSPSSTPPAREPARQAPSLK